MYNRFQIRTHFLSIVLLFKFYEYFDIFHILKIIYPLANTKFVSGVVSQNYKAWEGKLRKVSGRDTTIKEKNISEAL